MSRSAAKLAMKKGEPERRQIGDEERRGSGNVTDMGAGASGNCAPISGRTLAFLGGYHMSKKLGGCAALGWREPCNQLLEPGHLPDDFVSERRSVRGLSRSVFVLPSVPSFCSSVSPKFSPVTSGALSRAAQPPAPNTDRMIMQHRQEGPCNASGRDNMKGLERRTCWLERRSTGRIRGQATVGPRPVSTLPRLSAVAGYKHSDACGVQPGVSPPDVSDEWEIPAETLGGLNQKCVQCSAGNLTELWRASAVSSRGGTCTDYWVVRVLALEVISPCYHDG